MCSRCTDLVPEVADDAVGDSVVGTVGAIEDEPHSREVETGREHPTHDLDVATLRVPHQAEPTESRSGRPGRAVRAEPGLDLVLPGVGQLTAVGPEQLDPIVLERVVRR